MNGWPAVSLHILWSNKLVSYRNFVCDGALVDERVAFIHHGAVGEMFGSCCNLIISFSWLQPAASSVSAALQPPRIPHKSLTNHGSVDAGTMDTAVAGVAPAYSCIRCLQRHCTLAHQSINQSLSLSRSMSVKWNSTSPVNWMMMSSLFFWLRNLLRLLRFMMRPIINCCLVP